MLLIVEGLYLCYNEELLLKVYYKIQMYIISLSLALFKHLNFTIT